MIDRGALPTGWLSESIDRAVAELEARGFPVAPRPAAGVASAPQAPTPASGAANDWPVTINAAGDIAGSGTGQRTAPDGRPFAPTAGAAGSGHAISGSAAPPPPAARSPGRPMVDQKVYERVLIERNDLLAALQLANLRAGLAEALIYGCAIGCAELLAHVDATTIDTTEIIDTDDVHDLMHDARGG